MRVGEEHSFIVTKGVAASAIDLSGNTQTVKKSRSTNKTWHYFAYVDNSQDKPTDTTKAVSKMCFKPMETLGASTSRQTERTVRATDL